MMLMMQLRQRRAIVVLAIVSALLSRPCPALADLVAHYTFDNTVADTTGNHPGTLFGTTNYVPGVVGQALDFSLNSQGQPTYVELANPSTINFGQDFSISLWLKTTVQNQQDFLSKNITNGWAFPGKQFMTWNNELLADINSSGDFYGNFSSYGVNVTDGQWHHVVLTYCATISPYWNWFVDGYQQNSYGSDFTTGADTAAQHVRIGKREDTATGNGIWFIGQMDDVQIYDQTLTAPQAQSLFQNPGSVVTNPPPNPFTNSGTVFPRASTQAATAISTINYDGLSTPDQFMLLTMQGCINRAQPRVFLIGHGIVEMQNTLSTQFWLDQMRDYTQTNYTSAYAMIAAFTNGLNGCVLYNTNIFKSTSDTNLASINLVIMLCAKYGAIAMTTNQVQSLTSAQSITLPVLADARTNATNSWTNIYSLCAYQSRAGHADGHPSPPGRGTRHELLSPARRLPGRAKDLFLQCSDQYNRNDCHSKQYSGSDSGEHARNWRLGPGLRPWGTPLRRADDRGRQICDCDL